MPNMTATITSEFYRVYLSITDGPSIHDVFVEDSQITGVHIAFSDRKPTAIRFESARNHDVFVESMAIDKPESWPAWLRELVDTHRPADPPQR